MPNRRRSPDRKIRDAVANARMNGVPLNVMHERVCTFFRSAILPASDRVELHFAELDPEALVALFAVVELAERDPYVRAELRRRYRAISKAEAERVEQGVERGGEAWIDSLPEVGPLVEDRADVAALVRWRERLRKAWRSFEATRLTRTALPLNGGDEGDLNTATGRYVRPRPKE